MCLEISNRHLKKLQLCSFLCVCRKIPRYSKSKIASTSLITHRKLSTVDKQISGACPPRGPTLPRPRLHNARGQRGASADRPLATRQNLFQKLFHFKGPNAPMLLGFITIKENLCRPLFIKVPIKAATEVQGRPSQWEDLAILLSCDLKVLVSLAISVSARGCMLWVGWSLKDPVLSPNEIC